MEFNKQQIIQYLNKIEFPYVEDSLPEPNLETLTLLMKHHLSHLPYGNLSFFYYNNQVEGQHESTYVNNKTITKGVSIHPQDVYNKMIVNGKDGYCFEHAVLFHKVLNYFGYLNFIVACRSVDVNVLKKENKVVMSGMRHSANLVQIDGVKYLADIGWDGFGQFLPVPINEEETEDEKCEIVKLEYNQKLQVVFRYPPKYGNSNLFKKVYMAQYYHNDVITPLYFFALEPYFHEDINRLNVFTVLDNSKPFINHIQLRIQKGNKLYKIFDNQLKIVNMNNDKVERIHLKNEQGRRENIKKYFDIDLDDCNEYLHHDFVTFNK
ncbi:cysteine proteinase [Neoconidiobolus thromboides FSU 785]|nr:cysteine proteinase [Neoconidiobolus thromboides FSU 785]